MPIRVTGAKQALGGALHCQDQYLWITDRALQTAFDTFTSAWNPAWKRHGSHAPGPLEAARREGRRRRYGLSIGRDVTPAAAAAAIAQDVSAMAGGCWGAFGGFGLWGLPQPKWQPPRHSTDTERPHSAARETGSILFPSWLRQDLPIDTNSTQSDTFEDTLPGFEKRMVSLGLEDYKKELSSIENLHELQRLHTILAGCSLDAIVCSKLAFQHLVDLHIPTQDLITFLNDPRLNYARLDNIMTFIAHASKHKILPDQLNWTIRTFREYIKQRIVGSSHIDVLLDQLSTLLATTYGASITKHSFAILESLWTTVMQNSLSLERTTRISSLTGFCDQLQHLPKKRKSLVLAFQMLATTAKTDGTADLQQRLMLICADLLLAIDPRDAITYKSAQPSTLFTRELNLLPPVFANRCILFITRHLASKTCAARINGKICGGRLQALVSAWLESVRKCRHAGLSLSDVALQAVHTILAPFATPIDLERHMHGLSAKARCDAMLRHWSGRHQLKHTAGDSNPAEDAGIDEPRPSITLRDIGMRATIIRERELHLEVTSRTYVGFVLALADHDEPYQYYLNWILELLLSDQSESSLHAFAKIARCLHRKYQLRLPETPIQQFIESVAPTNPKMALQAFKLQRKPYLSSCPSLIPALLKDSSLSAQETFDLLVPYDPAASVPVSLRQGASRCSLAPSRIDLLHDMATSYAKMDSLSLRQMQTNVLRCYRILQNSGAPIDVRMSQALVLALIIQPKRSGKKVSVQRLIYVLDIVRRIEGDEVANQLDEAVWTHRHSFEGRET